jgi:hypothetical protein
LDGLPAPLLDEVVPSYISDCFPLIKKEKRQNPPHGHLARKFICVRQNAQNKLDFLHVDRYKPGPKANILIN